jgi:hypothetical protein
MKQQAFLPRLSSILPGGLIETRSFVEHKFKAWVWQIRTCPCSSAQNRYKLAKALPADCQYLLRLGSDKGKAGSSIPLTPRYDRSDSRGIVGPSNKWRLAFVK